MDWAAHTLRRGFRAPPIAASCAALILATSHASLAEDRTFTGAGNHPLQPARGAAGTPFIRLGYLQDYPDGIGDVIVSDAQRANSRTISNTIGAQTGSIPNNRNLSSYVWMWGQFLTHDLDLASTSAGSAVNGTASISVGAADPLGPNPIPMTRSNFVMANGARQQVNAITTWIDASMVYGSDTTRAAAMRTNSGNGAKLLTSAGNLPGFNTAGLANDNSGPTPSNQLFLCGDVRANENVGLTAMHTVFVREHNRLVDVISAQQPGLDDEQKYQLARKIVGAEMQAVTYNEFLPALLGTVNAPRAQDFAYSPGVDATITQSFAAAAFRFGHTTLSSQMPRVNNDGTSADSLALRDAFFNPSLLTDSPQHVEQLLKGGATQIAQEIDTLFVDDVRNFLFGPQGAGGMDLAALNTQRGRDHGLADYRQLRLGYNLSDLERFSQIPTNSSVRKALESLYGNINNLDAYIAGLAENHLPGSSLGPLFSQVIISQFERLRDGDRLFYRGDAAGLYLNGVLIPEISSIINLNTIRLADILALNAGLNSLAAQGNVFFAQIPGDFDSSGVTDSADVDLLFDATPGAPPASNLRYDINADGVVTPVIGAPGSDIDHLIRNILLTEYGDANLDRLVNSDDFNTLATSFGLTGKLWSQGNFDADALGIVNSDDFNLLASNFGFSAGADGIVDPSEWAMLAAAVPEPCAGLLLAGLAASVGSLRRRNHIHC
jgi:hypothetical protein